jgi:DNA-binding beta-propeller fold protein YncE
MKKIIITILMLGASAFAQPQLYPTNFLNCSEPKRMCDSYIRETYGDTTTAWTQPSGGALARIRQEYNDLCVYIFCDMPTHRLVIFSLIEDESGRTPVSAKSYGVMFTPQQFEMDDYAATDLKLDAPIFDSAGCLLSPVDVAVSSCGRYFDPELDFIFVLDQGNHRVAKFRYDSSLDSLIWVTSFGANHLAMPTALDYDDYGDEDMDNDDIYVTDAAQCSIMRFSSSGDFKTSYGGWGPGLADISYPTGIAVSTAEGMHNKIYVTDSHNHRVSRYSTSSKGPIIPDLVQYVFPIDNHPPLPLISSVDTDADGFVYVLDTFHHWIVILGPNLNGLDKYGEQGYEPGQFDYPSDIYIDGDEMQICELYADSSGIQTLLINNGSPKRDPGQLPGKFYLAQNYPNPFNSNTMIMFELREPGNVKIVIYDILGRKVTTLVDNKMSAGSHSEIWNGTNFAGRVVASGIYFYRLETDRNAATKKLLLLK